LAGTDLEHQVERCGRRLSRRTEPRLAEHVDDPTGTRLGAERRRPDWDRLFGT
jgi:hypothetical protein